MIAKSVYWIEGDSYEEVEDETIQLLNRSDAREAGAEIRPHSCDAAESRWSYDRSDHDSHGMAAAFGARFSCRCGSQEARFESCFRIDRQGPGLPNQG